MPSIVSGDTVGEALSSLLTQYAILVMDGTQANTATTEQVFGRLGEIVDANIADLPTPIGLPFVATSHRANPTLNLTTDNPLAGYFLGALATAGTLVLNVRDMGITPEGVQITLYETALYVGLMCVWVDPNR